MGLTISGRSTYRDIWSLLRLWRVHLRSWGLSVSVTARLTSAAFFKEVKKPKMIWLHLKELVRCRMQLLSVNTKECLAISSEQVTSEHHSQPILEKDINAYQIWISIYNYREKTELHEHWTQCWKRWVAADMELRTGLLHPRGWALWLQIAQEAEGSLWRRGK